MALKTGITKVVSGLKWTNKDILELKDYYKNTTDDCLRYAGAIPDDSERNVTIETKQEKVGENEETVIELFHYDSERL